MIKRIIADFGQFNFVGADQFKWSPATDTIYFATGEATGSDTGTWSLLHELGHATLGHRDFSNDIELLKIERAAWDKAVAIGTKYDIVIDSNHIEDCIDTYRLWLNQRSTCPVCSQVCLQNESGDYTCFNCGCNWQVPRSQACKVVRSTTKKPAFS